MFKASALIIQLTIIGARKESSELSSGLQSTLYCQTSQVRKVLFKSLFLKSLKITAIECKTQAVTSQRRNEMKNGQSEIDSLFHNSSCSLIGVFDHSDMK